ncbi:MAG: fibrobacter succinogenes major paralogous domain-containing protein [Bacteroidales bacterium]|nr:fibrobacter succinogenes major paralogous domain-containing protein [Bacteroidales bacterium]
MKKILFFTIVLLLVFVSCKSPKQVALDTTFLESTRCNLNPPGWGESLGVVSFSTDSIWTVSGNGITQIWSDAVTATNCRKTTFDGGKDYRKNRHRSDHKIHEKSNHNADCRSNPNFPGDLFSWCAVVRFQDVLCPDPWRVPTRQDFVDLDIALGGNGKFRRNQESVNGHSWQTQLDWYLNTWGGAFVGFCEPNGVYVEYLWGRYWSFEEHYKAGCALSFEADGCISPELAFQQHLGFSLRCVR